MQSLKDDIVVIVSKLRQEKLKQINAFLGFDACIDNIVRIVKGKNENNVREFFSQSRQFGEFLIQHENKSCGVELHTQLSKIGGNMVIAGNALGKLGIKSDCIGTFGFPDILPIFHSMSPNCRLYTIGDSVTTTAIEFTDSKVMMFDPGIYNELDWCRITEIVGIEKLRHLFSNKQLVMLLNWSEIANSTSIWTGILNDVLPENSVNVTKPYFLADFSDCSRRSKSEIRFAISLLSGFRNYYKVIFSLNQNELEIISGAMEISENTGIDDLIKKMYYLCKVDEIVIHRTRDAMAFDGINYEQCDSFYCETPALLTGGGDNFNAGFCFSKLYDFNLHQSLIVANAVSGYYVKTGRSPDIEFLMDFLHQNF